jgi:hypothetical protein
MPDTSPLPDGEVRDGWLAAFGPERLAAVEADAALMDRAQATIRTIVVSLDETLGTEVINRTDFKEKPATFAEERQLYFSALDVLARDWDDLMGGA